MSTTFTATFTVNDDNAHEELGEVARILEAIAHGFNVRNHYAGATVFEPVHDIRGAIVGSWQLGERRGRFPVEPSPPKEITS